MARVAWTALGGIDFRNGRVMDTHDMDVARQACSQLICSHQMQLVNTHVPFHASLDHLALGALSVMRFSFRSPVVIETCALNDSYILCLPVSGSSQYRHGSGSSIASPSQPSIVGGGERFQFVTSADYDAIIVCIKRSDLEHSWGQLAGDLPPRPICFSSELTTDGVAWRAIEPVLHTLANSSMFEQAGVSPDSLYSRVSDMLISTLLLNQPHSHLQCSPHQERSDSARLRRAKSFMLENLEEQLSLAIIAQALNMPARSIQAAFQAAEGMGPMQWLRLQRLLAVRQVLLVSSCVSTRISDVAPRFGFLHLGEFSQLYRRTFGERPSETLARR
jgi:AraC-like DNA-binding protein